MFRALLYWSTTGCASAGNPDTTPAEPHPTSNTQQTKNETANVVIQQHSRKTPDDGHNNARNMSSLIIIRNLSNDRSKTSSETIPPHSAI